MITTLVNPINTVYHITGIKLESGTKLEDDLYANIFHEFISDEEVLYDNLIASIEDKLGEKVADFRYRPAHWCDIYVIIPDANHNITPQVVVALSPEQAVEIFCLYNNFPESSSIPDDTLDARVFRLYASTE